MSAKLSEVLVITRTYLNDDNATQFNDAALIPKIQEAHRELQEELWQVGSPIVRAQSGPIDIPANTTQMTFDAAPQLPADLLCPTAMFEGVPYIPMTETFFIPVGYTPTAKLVFWSWQQEKIIFGGATANRKIIIQYRRRIDLPTDLNQEIGILFGESYLGARGAAIAAGTLGNKEVYDALTALAKENLAKVITANRGQQKPMLRP